MKIFAHFLGKFQCSHMETCQGGTLNFCDLNFVQKFTFFFLKLFLSLLFIHSHCHGNNISDTGIQVFFRRMSRNAYLNKELEGHYLQCGRIPTKHKTTSNAAQQQTFPEVVALVDSFISTL